MIENLRRSHIASMNDVLRSAKSLNASGRSTPCVSEMTPMMMGSLQFSLRSQLRAASSVRSFRRATARLPFANMCHCVFNSCRRAGRRTVPCSAHRARSQAHAPHSHSGQFRNGQPTRHGQNVHRTAQITHDAPNRLRITDTGNKDAIGASISIAREPSYGLIVSLPAGSPTCNR